MMNQQKFAELAGKARTFKATDLEGFRELTIQLIWIGLGVWLSIQNATWPLGQVVLGVGLWRTFAILHACGHGAFFNNRKLNDAIGFFLSPLCFIPYYPWKYIHQDHHVWTGWKDLDPTTRGLMKKPEKWQQGVLNFCWKSWIPLISIHYILTIFFDLTHSSIKVHNRKTGLAFLSVIWIIGFHLALVSFLGNQWLTIFTLSAFIYLNMGDISLLTQHVHLPLDEARGEKVGPKLSWEQDQYSHTMILPDFVTKWIVMGFNHHSLHHLFPQLPYYKAHMVTFQGEHTHGWKEWIVEAKRMKATELIYHTELKVNDTHNGLPERIDVVAIHPKVIVIDDHNRPVV